MEENPNIIAVTVVDASAGYSPNIPVMEPLPAADPAPDTKITASKDPVPKGAANVNP